MGGVRAAAEFFISGVRSIWAGGKNVKLARRITSDEWRGFFTRTLYRGEKLEGAKRPDWPENGNLKSRHQKACAGGAGRTRPKDHA